MKKLTLILIALITGVAQLCATNRHMPSTETVRYRVMYKWGLINKQAGSAVISLRETGPNFTATLTAHSEPWADKIFMVRDTLIGTMDKATLRPVFYEKIAHEGNEDKHDTVRFRFSGDDVTGECTRRVVKKGQLKVDVTHTLTATGKTVDMLSSFYYMRSLPFETWHKGQGDTVTIFSGKQKESLTLKYHGIEVVQVGDKRYQCFHITFVFTGNGGKKTSDDMDAWITTDSRRLPVQLEGKLPVGKVKCEIVQ